MLQQSPRPLSNLTLPSGSLIRHLKEAGTKVLQPRFVLVKNS
ncbi:hypothetical protein STRDD11_00909 [Streptococcus sp. DD11]|nr:hypothetical protein STRDD11_00909 [Streptococcus sp. DD11]